MSPLVSIVIELVLVIAGAIGLGVFLRRRLPERWSAWFGGGLAFVASQVLRLPILGAFAYQGMRGYLVTSDFFKDIQLSVSGALLLIIVLFIPAGAVGWLRQRFPILRRVLA